MSIRPAPRIDPRAESRTTRLAAQILPNRQLRTACPAQNRPLLPLAARPNRNRMPRQRNMAILASVVHAAALHLDRDNIRRRVIVHTPRLRVEIDSAHEWRLLSALISHPPHQNQLPAPHILPKRQTRNTTRPPRTPFPHDMIGEKITACRHAARPGGQFWPTRYL